MILPSLPPRRKTTMSKAPAPEKLFRDMTPGQKLAFMGKALVFFISGGFLYPTMWID